jgi:hypothetical protein
MHGAEELTLPSERIHSMANVFYVPQYQALSSSGAPLAGAKLYFFDDGTTTAAAVYSSAARTTALANPVVADSLGRFPQIYPNPTKTYRVRLTNSADVQQWQEDGVSLQFFMRTDAEIAAAVVPKNYAYEPGDVRRYGADVSGATDSTQAFQMATDTKHAVLIPKGIFLVTGNHPNGKPGIHTSGQTIWIGRGKETIIRSDKRVLTVMNGSGSRVENLYMENITPPWIIKRDPSNWTTLPVPKKSNDDGYQPTDNDYDIWNTLTDEQKTQGTGQTNAGIGPDIYFEGAASNIEVSHIFGRFVSIQIFGATHSYVHDCNFRGGKFLGGITFWNQDREVGQFNRAINNHVSYASNSGIVYSNNTDGLIMGNTVELVGESGMKTMQQAPGQGPAQNFNMSIVCNKTNRCFFDGLDCASNYPLTDGANTSHLIADNETYGNHGTGMNVDGRLNLVIGNKAWDCDKNGIWGVPAETSIIGNHCINTGRENPSGFAQIQVAGPDGRNLVTGNRIQFGAGTGTNGFGIHSTGFNTITNNYISGQDISSGPFDFLAGNTSNNTTQNTVQVGAAPADPAKLKTGDLFFWANQSTGELFAQMKMTDGSVRGGRIATLT